ncbi:MAG: hypothetical protein Q8K26_02110, partial [Candidatus Gracilibacteria bacterium]|nr:hypothetical protein [Candidatus Gracilibacteria bacterium]
MAEAQKTEVLPSITGFKGKLDWATQDDTITSRELRELRAKYEEEKGEIKDETQKKIEAFFKRMVDAMLKGGGFPITDPKKDFAFLQEHFGYSDDRIRQMQEFYDKKGALIVHQYDDGKVKFASGRGMTLGKGFFTVTGDVSYNKDNMTTLKNTINSEEKEKQEIIKKLLKTLPPTSEFPLITDKNF